MAINGCLLTKRIRFGKGGGKRQILLQDTNGPCAIIAIYNHLVLQNESFAKRQVKAKMMTYEQVTNQIIAWYEECIEEKAKQECIEEKAKQKHIDHNLQKESTHISPSQSQQLQSSPIQMHWETLKNASKGLCVDVRLGESIWDFAESKETRLFSRLKIPLCHCWLPNPEDRHTASKLYGLTSVEALFSLHDLSDSPSQPSMEPSISHWISESAGHQCTPHGIQRLHEQLCADSSAVLYMNNHFYNCYKQPEEVGGLLLLLVTDEGLAKEKDCVWQVLQNDSGAGEFLSAREAMSEDVFGDKRWGFCCLF